jgi:tRNA pseudouridine32 synthase/23S rRNA pseudouridine746 synthase
LALQLLARRVEVPLAKNHPPIVVEAPTPPHMRDALAACGHAGEPAEAPPPAA